ncbi:MAG TPA: hypothetical protein ENH02_05525 [Bacteroidetes bacterium]|nr:hypothetical protein [Bacteroidota bacterium]
MKKVLLQLALLIVIIILGYMIYNTIQAPVRFKKEKQRRELVVINKLKSIRTSQLIYKRMRGSFAGNFDTLESFLATAEIPVVKIIPDPADTTFTKTINDTVGYIRVEDTLFKHQPFTLKELAIIPFSGGEKFQMAADTIQRGGVLVHVFQVLAPYSAYLKGMDKQRIINLQAERENTDRYPGLKLGSLTEASTDGNWE